MLSAIFEILEQKKFMSDASSWNTSAPRIRAHRSMTAITSLIVFKFFF